MKVIFGIFLPICIFSFIAFGISVAVLGFEEVDEPISATNITGYMTELYGDYDNIELTTGSVNVSIYPTDLEKTILCVPSELSGDISALISDGTLVINSIRSIDDFDDFIGALSGGENASIEIYVPDNRYEEVTAYVNAGNAEINGLSAEEVYLELNAGNLTYANSEDSRCSSLSIDINAGNCTVYNADTEEYYIEVNAGNLDIYGLSGEGNVDMSAGNATLNYKELDSDLFVDVSLGNLTLNFPEGLSAELEGDLSAGNLEVDYDDIKTKITDSTTLVIGGGENYISAELSAGNVKISDKVKSKSAPARLAPPVYDMGTTATAVVTSTETAPVEITETAASVSIGDVISVDVSDSAVDVEIGNIAVSVDPEILM